MKRAKYASLGTGLILSMAPFTGACGQDKIEPPRSFSSEDKAVIVEARDHVLEFWHAKGIGAISADHLIILEGDATATTSCPAQNEHDGREIPPGAPLRSSDTFRPFYCPDSDNIVVTPGNLPRPVPDTYKGNQQAAAATMQFVVSHEFTHVVQAQGGDRNPTPELEDQATCYAGQIFARHYPENVEYIRETLLNSGASSLHGTGQHKADTFMQGFNGGEC